MLKKAKWLAKEATLRVKYMRAKDCIFCKIASGEIKPRDPVLETKKTIAFWDINPVAQTHILIVPRRHIESVLKVSDDTAYEIVDMFEIAQKIVAKMKLAAFRLAFNGGTYQHVPHLHMHLLSGGSVKWEKL